MFSADRGPHTNAVAETDAGAHAGAFPGTDARTDDGDARAHTGTVREPDARAVLTTDDGGPVVEADAVTLLVGSLLERQEYGSYRLR